MKHNPALSDSTRRALMLARYAASGAGATVVGTEHILAGLLQEPSKDASAAVLRAGGNVGSLQPRVSETSALGAASVVDSALPYSEHAKRAILAAAVEAQLDGHDVAQPRHLLCALAVEPDSSAAQLLARAGVTLQTLRAG